MITNQEKEIIQNAIDREYVRSLAYYGNWDDRSYMVMVWVIICELFEVLWAFARFDFHSKHGVFIEAIQVAQCMQKLCVQIIRREGMPDAS